MKSRVSNGARDLKYCVIRHSDVTVVRICGNLVPFQRLERYYPRLSCSPGPESRLGAKEGSASKGTAGSRRASPGEQREVKLIQAHYLGRDPDSTRASLTATDPYNRPRLTAVPPRSQTTPAKSKKSSTTPGPLRIRTLLQSPCTRETDNRFSSLH